MKTKYTDCKVVNQRYIAGAEESIKSWLLLGYVPQGSLQLVLNSGDAPSYVILMVKETEYEPNRTT